MTSEETQRLIQHISWLASEMERIQPTLVGIEQTLSEIAAVLKEREHVG